MKKSVGSDRRGFLALLGLGSVAGPNAIKEAVSGQGFNKLGQMTAASLKYRDNYNDSDDDDDETYESNSRKKSDNRETYTNSIKNMIDEFNHTKTKDYLVELPNFIKRVDHLDPDLLSNRSLSVYARIRLQALRNLDTYKKEELNRQERYLNNVVRQARRYLTDSECFDLIAQNIIRDKLKPLPTLEAFIKVLGPRGE